MIELKLLHPCKAGEICNQDLCVVYATDENNIRYCVKGKEKEDTENSGTNFASAIVCSYREDILDEFEITNEKVDNPCEIE